MHQPEANESSLISITRKIGLLHLFFDLTEMLKPVFSMAVSQSATRHTTGLGACPRFCITGPLACGLRRTLLSNDHCVAKRVERIQYRISTHGQSAQRAARGSLGQGRRQPSLRSTLSNIMPQGLSHRARPRTEEADAVEGGFECRAVGPHLWRERQKCHQPRLMVACAAANSARLASVPSTAAGSGRPQCVCTQSPKNTEHGSAAAAVAHRYHQVDGCPFIAGELVPQFAVQTSGGDAGSGHSFQHEGVDASRRLFDRAEGLEPTGHGNHKRGSCLSGRDGLSFRLTERF